jgi:L-2-hydroxyglutarate oxidase LhgO
VGKESSEMESMEIESDFLIIGSGIIGMSIAQQLYEDDSNAKIIILEKEQDVSMHSSGRNSGVLHAGFYYTADSLKAKFTRDGNRMMQEYCDRYHLKINRCAKVVVASDESELEALYELNRRGIRNHVDVAIIDTKDLYEIDPNVKTYQKALYSPNTATVDPIEISTHLKKRLMKHGIKFYFQEGYAKRLDRQTIKTTKKRLFHAKTIINCAGLYADKIARDFGYSQNYVIIPFKGIYLKYRGNDIPVKTNVYPVPNLKNPFLGVHYTVTVDGTVKIGPTAIPAFWRENYEVMQNFRIDELWEILRYEMKLFTSNAFNFRLLAMEEMRKYRKKYFVSLARKMVHNIDTEGFDQWSRPGIRAQLLDTRTLELLQDFVVEGDKESVHILNAVSPAFTSAFPFAQWVVEHYIKKGA